MISTFNGKGGVLAHVFYPTTNRKGTVHFDEDETWSVDKTAQNPFTQPAKNLLF